MSVGSFFWDTAVASDDPIEQADKVPDFGVDSREVRLRTTDPPQHDALKAVVANQRPAGLYLK